MLKNKAFFHINNICELLFIFIIIVNKALVLQVFFIKN